MRLRLSPEGWACIWIDMANLTEFSPADAIAVLSRTPTTLNALLRGLPNVWVRGNEGKDTWNAFDVVGHLISGERTDWMPRVGIMLEKGEAEPFDPFDRFAQLKESQDKSLEQLSLGRLRPLAKGEPCCAAGTEFTARRLNPARKASSAGSGNAIGTSGDMGRSRPHSCASTVPSDGAPVS